jgi:Transcriptional regulator containing GAF, AAA-type ATPase, and DNA binding domains
MQPYLLRVLEEGKIYPLGDNKPRRVDFRLIAATNKDLRTETTAADSGSIYFIVSQWDYCGSHRCANE